MAVLLPLPDDPRLQGLIDNWPENAAPSPWHLEELPDPYRSEALADYAILTQARIVGGTPWLAALTSMRRTIRAWGDKCEERTASDRDVVNRSASNSS